MAVLLGSSVTCAGRAASPAAPETLPVRLPSAEGMKAAQQYSESTRGQTLVVMQDGKIIFEAYANGGGKDRLQMLASGSKSLVGVAAMAAVQDGIIKLDDPASQALAEWKDDPLKANITYRQLLTLTSGLMPGERGNAVRGPTWKDIIAKPLTGKPSGQFEYGAYHLNAFAAALERKLGNETFEAYLNRRILDPLGIKVEWRFKCADGHPQVGGGAFMTARDWATFGEFIRLHGKWNDKQLIDAKLLAECFQGTQQNPAYGLTWWLKKPVSPELRRTIPILSREWGDVANSVSLPDDLVAACGAGKQRLYVIPSLRMVVVRQGSIPPTFSDTHFLAILLGAGADGR
jgi:CubicO group peptidase (beta-lactamase class C family)